MTRSANNDPSDDDTYSSDDDNDNDTDNPSPLDALDQDEDVIQAAEEAQEEVLDEAAESAERCVTVTGSKQKAASTAVSKVSVIVFLGSEYLLITLYSSRNLHLRLITQLVSVKN